MIPWIVVSYYTVDTIYEKRVKLLEKSLCNHNIPHWLEPIRSLGSWFANVNYKPTFLKQMFHEFPEQDIVYLDCDAEVLKYPALFDELTCPIAVHKFDRSVWPRGKGFEILSGTIFLRNCQKTYNLVEQWEVECKKNPKNWDQRSLQKVLGEDYYNLPPEYCKIFDLPMCDPKKAVIVHHQTSRLVRENGWKLV